MDQRQEPEPNALPAATRAFESEMRRTVRDLAASMEVMQISADAVSGRVGQTHASVAVTAAAAYETAGVINAASTDEKLSVALQGFIARPPREGGRLNGTLRRKGVGGTSGDPVASRR